MTRVVLNGSDWHVKEYYGEDWRWRDAHMPVNRDPRSWYPASVPGTIQNDLWAADAIPNPYFERNSLLIEWIPARTWVYRKTFTLDSSLKGQRAKLTFEGVDYEARFFLNGIDLGTHVGMYTLAMFEVTDILNFDGDNVLAVVVEAAPREEPQISRTSKVRTHKSRMTYWWDFCPRMIHIGLWQGVCIDFSGQVRIAEIEVRPTLSDDFQQAQVTITTKLDASRTTDVIVETTVYFGGAVITSGRTEHILVSGDTAITMTLPITQPRLWYPNGYGDQPLYEANIHVVEMNDTKLDRCTTRFGIRKIEFAPNETSDPTARPYTLVVNGQRIYLKGWNWVPMDVMYGVERPSKLEHLLTLAKNANVNLLRVWGGGLIETEAFYDLCDELGLMVWQEFIMSSSGMDNNPSTDPDFVAFMKDQAEQIVPRKRHHPSLVIWCGGNELQSGDEQPLDDRHPTLAALKEVVNRLHPDALWLPTSPTGRVFSNSLDNIAADPTALHDVHGPWEYQGVTGQYTLYNQGTSLLHSEFGVEALTNLKSLNATIAPENQFPVTLNNPIWHHLGAWWVKAAMWRETFGEIKNIETLVCATQLTQYDGLRYALEADRRRKYQNSGTLPWQFNEPYPMAACTSAVDYYGQPKPAYYAVKHAYEPLHLSAQFDTTAWDGRDTFTAQIWGYSSLREATHARVLIEITGLDGHMYGGWDVDATFEADSTHEIIAIELPLSEIQTEVFFLNLVLDLDEHIQRNRYIFTKAANLAPLLSVPATTLTVEHDFSRPQGSLTITNTGDSAALFVWLEDDRPVKSNGAVYFEDNHFCLMPHEQRAITVTWKDVTLLERHLSVQGWNTNTWIWKG